MPLGVPKRWKVLIAVLVSLFVLYLSGSLWLPFLGNFLVVKDHLQNSDVIIVLGTDSKGDREAWAAELYKKGLAKRMIMCGYEVGWRSSTADIMKKHAVHLGVPDDAIILDYGWDNHGTWDNAINSLKIIKENHFRSLIVVTSNYHTRRSRFAFNQVFKNADVRILISPCPGGFFAPGEWWKSRELIKGIFLEYIKLIYYIVFPRDLAQYTKE